VGLLIRGFVRVAFQVAVFGAVFFLPIGTWRWPRALQFLLVFGVISLASTLVLGVLAPASLEARVKKAAVKNRPAEDRWITGAIALTHIAWFLSIPNDVFRWQTFPRPPEAVSLMGGVLCLLGYGIMLAAVWQNSFAAPVVGDQSHREQVLVDTGLYSLVRHPMYLGHLIFLLGLPLWLESSLGLVLVPVVFAPLVVRILFEEKSLRGSLPGYLEYTARVRSRLLPGIW